jgi:predicted TIM-barrel fold metal-dependent hydrolase
MSVPVSAAWASWLAVALIVPSCTPAPASPADSAAIPASANDVVPYADHHVHIYTLATATDRNAMPLQEVRLPGPLDALLRQRVALVGDREAFRNRLALAPVYTDDAVFRNSSFNTWGRGAAAASINASLQATFAFWGEPFRMMPLAYETVGSHGFIIGHYTRGQGDSTEHVGQFHLSLRQDAGGAWRISAETAVFETASPREAAPTDALLAEMDAAGVRKALVLSSAYWGTSIVAPAEGEYERVRAENDWVGEQVALHPDRLVGFCGFNPLREYALREIARCAASPHLTGLKLHMADANVDLDNPQHVEQLRAVFREANAHRLPIATHIATQALDFGPRHVHIYMEQIFSEAPDIPIQIAHLAGHGPSHGNEALEAFVELARRNDPRMRHLYFDVGSNVMGSMGAAYLASVAQHIRTLGVERIVFASDRPAGGPDFTIGEAWAQFRRLPLTEEELRTIAGNVAPYMR